MMISDAKYSCMGNWQGDLAAPIIKFDFVT